MTVLPRGVAQPAELKKQLDALAPFPPGVANLRYTIEDDWTGEPVIFFWITLTDEASDFAVLHQTAQRITNFIEEGLDPVGKWDLFPHFSFRSQSEQAQLQGKDFG